MKLMLLPRIRRLVVLLVSPYIGVIAKGEHDQPKRDKSDGTHSLCASLRWRRCQYTLLLLATPCFAQTAAVPASPVTGTAQIKSQTITITTAKNGGKVSFTIPAQTAAVTGTTAIANAPVNLSGFTGAFACTLGPDSTVIVTPDGTKSITDVHCSVTQVKP